jgi:hypothetical protein
MQEEDLERDTLENRLVPIKMLSKIEHAPDIITIPEENIEEEKLKINEYVRTNQ